MEYTPAERSVFSALAGENFSKLSGWDVVNYASRLGELRPEVAKDIVAQFPEFTNLMKSTFVEYKGMVDSVLEGDNESIREYYGFANKVMENAEKGKDQFYEHLRRIQADYSKCLEKPDLSNEELIRILEGEYKLAEIANAKDAELRRHEKQLEENVYRKDTEKRAMGWKIIGGLSVALIAFVGLGLGFFGGDNSGYSIPKKDI